MSYRLVPYSGRILASNDYVNTHIVCNQGLEFLDNDWFFELASSHLKFREVIVPLNVHRLCKIYDSKRNKGKIIYIAIVDKKYNTLITKGEYYGFIGVAFDSRDDVIEFMREIAESGRRLEEYKIYSIIDYEQEIEL